MSTNFFFKTLSVDNYRGLKNLKIEKLRRINLIGGLNGTGKSTLLDIIFLILDRRNPAALLRPFTSRGMPMPFPNGFNYVFGVGGMQKNVEIKSTTLKGDVEFSLSLGQVPNPMTISAANNPLQPALSSPATFDSNQLGMHLKVKLNGKEDEAGCIAQVSQEALNYNLYKIGTAPLVGGAYLSSTIRASPLEDAQRFSNLMKEKRGAEITEALQFVNPDLSSFQLLQDGNMPTLYATMKDGTMLQTSMLGGGFQSVLSIALIMMSTKDGIILFDEIDSTIHYSKLNFFWALVSRLADKNNCQVFAVTHSRECIVSALNGAIEENLISDIQYIRLENDDNESDSIIYTGEELKEALASGWEIR